MTEDHRKKLEKYRPELVRNMNPTEVIDELLSHEVLTPRAADEISRAGGIDAQNGKLMDYLLRKPDSAYEKFCDALQNTGQSHVKTLLRYDVLTDSCYKVFSYQNMY